jgi:hypothetical protein
MNPRIESGEHKMRYCGGIRISIVLTDRDEYVCLVSDDDDEVRVVVNSPKVITLALDSEEAFDDTARAALAFAIDERDNSFEDCDADDSGFVITREDPRS